MQFVGGLFIYAVAASLTIRSGLGVGPWDAFHVGLSRVTGIDLGLAAGLTSLAIVVLGLTIGVRPSVGTVGNATFGAIFLTPVYRATPAPEGEWALPWAVAYLAAGILFTGVATGLYIGAAFGAGPRDGLMVGISRRWNYPVKHVRTAIELVALACGWAMGGPLGLGTVAFALGVGPAVQWGLRRFEARPQPLELDDGRTIVARPEERTSESG